MKHVDVASLYGVLWGSNMLKYLKYSMRFLVIWDIFSQYAIILDIWDIFSQYAIISDIWDTFLQYAIISDIWDIFLQYAPWMSKSHLEKKRLLLSESSKCWSYHALAKASYMGSSTLNVLLQWEKEI